MEEEIDPLLLKKFDEYVKEETPEEEKKAVEVQEYKKYCITEKKIRAQQEKDSDVKLTDDVLHFLNVMLGVDEEEEEEKDEEEEEVVEEGKYSEAISQNI